MIGDVCGDLTVIGESGNNSLVKCKCGTIRMYPTAWIDFGMATSCGCRHKESPKAQMIKGIIRGYTQKQYLNPTGLRFGKLTVIKRYRDGINKWVCRCDCGNEIVVRKLDLFSHTVTDCGNCKLEENNE